MFCQKLCHVQQIAELLVTWLHGVIWCYTVLHGVITYYIMLYHVSHVHVG